MCRQLNKSFNINELRSALGAFPTGVAVVTAAPEPHQPVGVTVSSFNSISLRPALVAWCIDTSSASYPTFARCSHFSISVLADDQEAVARRFATRGADKFAGIPVEDRRGPLIPGACAWFRCLLYRQILLGDHLMLVGQVEELGLEKRDSLVFARGSFANLVRRNEAIRAA